MLRYYCYASACSMALCLIKTEIFTSKATRVPKACHSFPSFSLTFNYSLNTRRLFLHCQCNLRIFTSSRVKLLMENNIFCTHPALESLECIKYMRLNNLTIVNVRNIGARVNWTKSSIFMFFISIFNPSKFFSYVGTDQKTFVCDTGATPNKYLRAVHFLGAQFFRKCAHR